MKTKLLLLALLLPIIGFCQTINLELFADEFDNPSEIVNAGDDRLFVVEQSGHIRILNADGTTNGTDFLDIESLITFSGEQGLLGLAFHPDYATNGYFYVNYINTDGNTVIARYSKSTDNENTANPASGLVMLTIEQPFENHNGGCLRFGPDGYLYVATGDGGDGGDPGNRAQSTEVLLGKILRLDVNAAPYIPEDNPFVGVDGADEIWAYGLRNPWKFSFNRLNNDLWIADVGQGTWEEINKSLPTAAGINYGWKCYEGNAEFDTSQCSETGVYTMPIAQYANNDSPRCSITGGYVYTGTAYPNMLGKYFFADYCTGEIGMVDSGNNLTWAGDFDDFITTFGEDADGELYAATANGNIYKVIDTSVSGIDDLANSPFSLHPNPANDELYIDMNDNTIRATASIFNVNGQLVLEEEIEGGEYKLDTSKLQSGIYVISIKTPSSISNGKLVIN